MTIEVVYVGSAGHLRRYKVVDESGRYMPGGLFRTEAEAVAFIVRRQLGLEVESGETEEDAYYRSVTT